MSAGHPAWGDSHPRGAAAVSMDSFPSKASHDFAVLSLLLYVSTASLV